MNMHEQFGLNVGGNVALFPYETGALPPRFLRREGVTATPVRIRTGVELDALRSQRVASEDAASVKSFGDPQALIRWAFRNGYGRFNVTEFSL